MIEPSETYLEKYVIILHTRAINNPIVQRNGKNYFWPIGFGFPMYDPYNTGPMSEPVLSPVGPPVMPRRNPYYPKPTNPFLNPYTTQMRSTMAQACPCHHRGPMGGLRGPIGPMGPPPRGPMGPPPMGPMGPPPMGMPPMGPRPF